MDRSADFYSLEKGILALKDQIDALDETDDIDKKDRIAALRANIEKEWAKVLPQLSIFNIVQIARHPKRPYTLDYVSFLFRDFIEMHGDRRFADDPAIVAGLAFYKGRTVAVIGHQKGRTTRARIDRNFGQANPEGYRKALRIMLEAEKFGFPVITLIDTPGAYPGIGAEERGQAEAIAYNLREMAGLRTPIIVTVTGEGGSGGALAVAIGDRVNMLEHAIYSVISPEGCASILFRDSSRAEEAATAMKITAPDLKAREIVDEVIPEPAGGAHVNHEEQFRTVDEVLSRQLGELSALGPDELLEQRYQKFRHMGRLGHEFEEVAP
jgi:acetyl-CoA carboxylase carboxyl transferase subunit alpha